MAKITLFAQILQFLPKEKIRKYPWHFSNLVHSLRLNTFTKLDLNLWLDNPFSNIGEDADLSGVEDTPI